MNARPPLSVCGDGYQIQSCLNWRLI